MKLIGIIDHETFGSSFIEAALETAPYSFMLWYRIKISEGSEIAARASALRKALPQTKLVLSERADIASACGFQGVHLNASSMSPEAVKRAFPSIITGYSSHSLSECALSSADYVTLSPIFHTPKKYAVSPLGLARAPRKNVFALGGVKAANCALLKELGYEGVAGIRICKEAREVQRL